MLLAPSLPGASRVWRRVTRLGIAPLCPRPPVVSQSVAALPLRSAVERAVVVGSSASTAMRRRTLHLRVLSPPGGNRRFTRCARASNAEPSTDVPADADQQEGAQAVSHDGVHADDSQPLAGGAGASDAGTGGSAQPPIQTGVPWSLLWRVREPPASPQTRAPSHFLQLVVVPRSSELQAAEDALSLALTAMVVGTRPPVSTAMIRAHLGVFWYC